MYCPYCGTDLGDGDYCQNCETGAFPAPTPLRYCASCGSEVPDEDQYCRYCGESLRSGSEGSGLIIEKALRRSLGTATLDASSLAVGLATGALASVVGYLLVYLLAARRLPVSDGMVTVTLSDIQFSVQTFVGFIFYVVHRVPLQTEAPILEDVTGLSTYALVPPLVLLAGGTAAALLARRRDGSLLLSTAGFVAGYFALAVAGAFAFTATVSGLAGATFTVRPVLGTAVTRMGVAYPLIYGSLAPTLLVLWRHFDLERTRLLYAGVVAGLLSVAAPLLPGVVQVVGGYRVFQNRNRDDGMSLVVVGIAVTVLGVSLATAATSPG